MTTASPGPSPAPSPAPSFPSSSPAASFSPSASLERLCRDLPDVFVLPGEASWNDARSAWNLAVDQAPAAVALPASAEQVVGVVDLARQAGLRIAAQSTGHQPGALAEMRGTILLKTTRMRGVDIDAARRRARVSGGSVWADVTTPAANHDLAPLAGTAPDVGVAGYTLGGGLSWLGRKYGLAANSVESIDIVTADGRNHRVHADAGTAEKRDLFWALRGGGGSFGVVTGLEFRLYSVPRLHAGWLAWPWEQATEVLAAWSAWTDTVPDEVTSAARLLRVPDLPGVPTAVRGRQLVVVDAAMLVDDDTAGDLLVPLRQLGPEIDTMRRAPVSALGGLHMDPDRPVPSKGDHRLLDALPHAAIQTIVDLTGPGSESPLVVVELRHLGGALARPSAAAGALPTLDGAFMLFGGGLVVAPEMSAAIDDRLEALFDSMRPWVRPTRYANFAGYGSDARSFFPPGVHPRLERVKAAVDPQNMFVANHPLSQEGS